MKLEKQDAATSLMSSNAQTNIYLTITIVKVCF